MIHVREGKKRTAPSTHWLSELADNLKYMGMAQKKAPPIWRSFF